MTNLLMTYYGDDFTGSTDAMSALTTGGVPTVLFLEPPTAEILHTKFADVRAVGVAGISRALIPTEMAETLPPVFSALRELGAPLCHYKICSTFDSSPTIGSIGCALDIGYSVFRPAFVPIVVGTPVLKRYVAFGNLFATVGDETVRIDRHPTMSKHPVTPMVESDLRRHLAKQTKRAIGLVDLLHLGQTQEMIEKRLESLLKDGNTAIVFDTLDNDHLLKVGRLLWTQAAKRPLFVVGSSGVEHALTAYWRDSGQIKSTLSLSPPGRVGEIVVMSGSASPVTAEQISWAEANGFHSIRLNVRRLLDLGTEKRELHILCQEALTALERGQSVIFYSVRGPDDPNLRATYSLGSDSRNTRQRLGTVQGLLLKLVLEKTNIQRVCVAGGDTSGLVAKQLGLYALSVCSPLTPGIPLCKAHSHFPRFDGLQLALKGGQVGPTNYFGRVKDGQ